MPKRLDVFVLAVILISASACSRDPRAAEAKFLANGKAKRANNDYVRALLEFKNASTAMPHDAEPYYQIGVTYLMMHQTGAAATFLRKAVSMNGNHLDAQIRLAELVAIHGDPRSMPEVEKRMLAVLNADSTNADALNILALAQARSGNLQQAREYLEKATAHYPADLKSAVNLARVRLAANDTAGAENALLRAVQQAPNSAAALAALGDFYLAMGRREQAGQTLQKALHVEPGNVMALRSTAALYVSGGQAAEAGAIYRRIAAIPEYKTAYAEYLTQSGKAEEALAEYKRLLAANPDDRPVRTRLVRACISLHRVSEAERIITDVLQRNPKDTDALLQRSVLYIMARRFDRAAADLEQVFRFNPDSAQAHFFMSRVHKGRGNPLSQRQELTAAVRLAPNALPARLELADELLLANSPRPALQVLDEAPAAQKESLDFIVSYNWAVLALQRYDAVQPLLDKGLAVSRTPDLLLQAALLKAARKQPLAARALVEEGLKQNGEDVRLLSALAQTYAVQHDLAQAVAVLTAHVARYPGSAALQRFAGRWLLEHGNAAQGRQFLQKARDNGDATADLLLADLDIRSGNLEPARERLKRLLAADAENTAARLSLGQLEELAGNAPASIDHYRQVLAHDPNNVMALNNLAYSLADSPARPDEALGYAQKAKNLAPDNPAIDDTLGWALYWKGAPATALQHLEQAAAREDVLTRDGLARVKYHLATVCFSAGQPARGTAALKEAIRLNPALPERALAEQVQRKAVRN